MASLGRAFSRLLTMNLQKRLVLGFLIATCLTGLIATVVGIRTINRNTIDEVQRRVEQDIHTAELIYGYQVERLKLQIQWIALQAPLADLLHSRDLRAIEDIRSLVRIEGPSADQTMHIDMLSLVDAQGRVVHRLFNPGAAGEDLYGDPIVQKCLREKRVQAGTTLLPAEVVLRENPRLASRIAVPIVKTPQSISFPEKIKEQRLSEGMVLRAAYPIVRGDRIVGALVGGALLTRDYTIVDQIKETVYRNEKHKGQDMGYATIFQGGVRISTNVMADDGQRAIGTTVSEDVYEKVLVQGQSWIGRAFVVNGWYISAYNPIYDPSHRIIGILYTGILEDKYRDMRLKTLWIFLGITLAGMVFAFFLSYRLGNTIIGRIRALKVATDAIAAGNLNYQLQRDRFSAFGMLDQAFNNMVVSLKDRDERLQRAAKRVFLAERLAALGQMAAGIAHEINNPLGGILLYSNLLLEDLPPDHPARPSLEKIIFQTNRCKAIVMNLLDFAREPSDDMTPLAVNDVIRGALGLVKDQSMFHDIRIDARLAPDLPFVRGDRLRLEEVFLNLFVNAVDAMDGRGTLTIATNQSAGGTVKVRVCDTGKGIDRASLPHIFEPFYTTKEPGKGTGQGLFITYGIIRRHGGFLEVESEVGKGSAFTVSLPSCLIEEGRDTGGKEESRHAG